MLSIGHRWSREASTAAPPLGIHIQWPLLVLARRSGAGTLFRAILRFRPEAVLYERVGFEVDPEAPLRPGLMAARRPRPRALVLAAGPGWLADPQ